MNLEILNQFLRTNCIDGVAHHSTEGYKRMHVIYCDNETDGEICVKCWGTQTSCCNFDEDYD